ncbi:hypothetical protein ZMTM_05660 [Methyloradius palustris]|uniref:Uncharacterized protein n=1 Tax=Methyloradius palustris TaxID=2778876 RepID=A0A8D5G6Z3_9PROT|nr:hypothetical protein ZMTM_05660 [Methyloradius palustris]
MLVQQGTLFGKFKGFRNQSTMFFFADGSIWRQNENKQFDHVAYMPYARIMNQEGRHYIEVEDVDVSVEVVWVGVSRAIGNLSISHILQTSDS